MLFVGATVVFVYQLRKFGPAIKKLTEIEQLSQLSSLVSSFGDIRRAFGEVAARIRVINNELTKISERQDRLEAQNRELLQANQDIQDLIDAGDVDQAWEEIRQNWRTARDHLEAIISGDEVIEKDLGEFRRNTYGKIIDRLVELRKLDRSVADNFKKMESIYLAHRNRKRDVTPDALADFRKAAKLASP